MSQYFVTKRDQCSSCNGARLLSYCGDRLVHSSCSQCEGLGYKETTVSLEEALRDLVSSKILELVLEK